MMLAVRCARLAAPMLIVVALSACVSITAYDSTTDELLTGIQKRNVKFFMDLKKTYPKIPVSGQTWPPAPGCRYSVHSEYYDATNVDIRVAQLRADAIPDNDVTSANLARLMTAIGKFEEEHKSAEITDSSHCLTPEYVQAMDTTITVAVGAILKTELAKKVK